MDNYTLNKYTIVSLMMDGTEVFERFPFLDGETPEQHEAAILSFITMMRETFGIDRFDTATRYEYEIVFVDPTLG